MANFQIPAPPSGKRPVDTYQWLGKILEVLANTKGVEWHTNNILTIKQLGDSIGNDTNFVATVDKKIHNALQPVNLSQGTDLNTLETTGLYSSGTDANTVTLLNKPDLTTGFILQVFPVYSLESGNRVIQLAYSRATGVIYARTKSETSGWTPWIKFLNNTDATNTNTANKIVQRDASGNFSAGTITAALSGNASTATTLQTARTINGTSFNGSSNITTANWGTARTITIGNTGKSVNGSANVSWSLSEIGALPLTGGTLTTSVFEGLTIKRSDTNGSVIQYSNSNGPLGRAGYLSSGEFVIRHGSSGTNNVIVDSSGNMTVVGTITSPTIKGALSGNASTATKLQTARTINGTSFDGSANITTANWGTARNITIGGTKKSVNGSADVSWSLSEIGAAATSHTHTSSQISDATNANTANMIVKRDASGNFSAGTITAALSGNATTATTLATARTINGTSFNGSANITTANWGTARTITIGSTGKSVNGSANVSWSLSEIGAAAASHTHTSSQISDATNANTANMIVKRDASGNFSAGTITASLSGNATTATTLATARTINGTSFNGSANITTANWGTARTITIGSTGKSVNGSANVSWSLSEIGAAAVSHTHSNYVPTTDYTLTTITKTLTLTTSWQDTGITGSNLESGSYMIQISGMSSDATSMWSEIFTGTMSWTSATTNSTDSDEIILHKAGHASNGRMIYLRTIRSASSGYLKLQIAASHTMTSSSFTFKFRKLI